MFWPGPANEPSALPPSIQIPPLLLLLLFSHLQPQISYNHTTTKHNFHAKPNPSKPKQIMLNQTKPNPANDCAATIYPPSIQIHPLLLLLLFSHLQSTLGFYNYQINNIKIKPNQAKPSIQIPPLLLFSHLQPQISYNPTTIKHNFPSKPNQTKLYQTIPDSGLPSSIQIPLLSYLYLLTYNTFWKPIQLVPLKNHLTSSFSDFFRTH